MKNKILAAALAAAVLLSGCDLQNEKQRGAGSSGGIKLSPIIIKEQKDNLAQTSSGLSEIFGSPETPTENTDGAANEEPVTQDLQWEEWEYIENLYTNAFVTSKAAPFAGAHDVRMYEADTPVSVVALTSTRYFKLDNGDYIPTDRIYIGVITNTETVKTEFIYDPPERTVGNIVYDPKKALDFAKEHWEEEDTFCAEFASECLTAGGPDYDETSSTKLFNKLMESGLGCAVTVNINKDGTLTLPDNVYPGDIIFYYCADENMMSHTAIYNGDTKDGFAKAYAHNLADNGETAFKYYRFCREGCGASLEKVVVFCFYRDRNSVKKPTAAPKIVAEIVNGSVELTWDTDFVYRSSELIITDKRGKIVYRREMGTDKSEIPELEEKSKYAAYVVFTVYENIRARSENCIFAL